MPYSQGMRVHNRRIKNCPCRKEFTSLTFYTPIILNFAKVSHGDRLSINSQNELVGVQVTHPIHEIQYVKPQIDLAAEWNSYGSCFILHNSLKYMTQEWNNIPLQCSTRLERSNKMSPSSRMGPGQYRRTMALQSGCYVQRTSSYSSAVTRGSTRCGVVRRTADAMTHRYRNKNAQISCQSRYSLQFPPQQENNVSTVTLYTLDTYSSFSVHE